MTRFFLIVALAALGIMIPWQLGYDPAMLAASSDLSVGWTAVRPAPVVAGERATVEVRVQSRVAGAATVEAVVRDATGGAVWQQRWTDQTFRAWQNRTFTASWAVPAGQAAGPYTLAVTAVAAQPAQPATAARAGQAPATAGRKVTFRVIKAASSPAATATAMPPTATAVPPTRTPDQPTATAVPSTATRVPPTATQVPPTATRVPPTATAVPPTATATQRPPATSPPSTGAPGLDAEEARFFGLLNQYRASRGLRPLELHPILNASADWMSRDMASHNRFSHIDSLGRHSWVRIDSFGLPARYFTAENIAAGTQWSHEVLGDWQGSRGHDAALLGPYQYIGIGRAYDATSTFGWYWTLNFAAE